MSDYEDRDGQPSPREPEGEGQQLLDVPESEDAFPPNRPDEEVNQQVEQPVEEAAAFDEPAGDDPVEDALYTSFMQALATGADAAQAFNVSIHAAKQLALDHGIPEMVFEGIASDLFGPYSAALESGQSPQEALRTAFRTLED